jgi:hypothetical protein
LGGEFGCGDVVVAEGLGDDRGGHFHDVLADGAGPAGGGGDAEVADERGRDRIHEREVRSLPVALAIRATARTTRAHTSQMLSRNIQTMSLIVPTIRNPIMPVPLTVCVAPAAASDGTRERAWELTRVSSSPR